MRNTYIYIIGMAMALAPASAWGQEPLSARTAIVAHSDNSTYSKGTSTGCNLHTAYVTIDTNKTSWRQLGLTPLASYGNTATVRLDMGYINALAQEDGVEHIQLAAKVEQMLDVARKEAGTDKVIAGTGLQHGYTGEGVVVGIVDAGFDYTHAAFRNPTDGSCRIRRIWEQKSSTLEGAKAPEKYGYGLELDTPALIEAAQGDCGDNSHGTHVAAIATGADRYKEGAYTGNAPGSDIVLVAVDLTSCTSADICNAVQYIFDYADKVNKPCVVNLSLGNHEGPHDGTSSFDTMTDMMQGPGRLIIGAAGNHRADKFHIDHSFASADDNPLKTFVCYKSAPSNSNIGGEIEIWGEKGSDFIVEISAYSLFNKKDAVSATVYPAEGVTEVSFDRYATGSWKVASETSPLNGKPHVVLSSNLSGIRTNYAIAITVTPKNEGRVNIWADNTKLGLESRDMEGFTAPDGSSTIAEIGGTGKRILTVGAYTTRNEYPSGTLNETIGDIGSFSSFGPTADGRMKPEICAPGCFVISAVSSNDLSGTIIEADRNESFDRTNIYGYMQGTSMAAPFVTGIVATWLQAYPQLSPEELHSIAAMSARNDEYTTTLAHDKYSWGYGKINAFEGLKECISKATAGCRTIDNIFDGDIELKNGMLTVAFPRDTHAYIALYTLSGQRVTDKDMGNIKAGNTVTTSISNLPKGTYILRISTSAGTKSIRFGV